MPSSRSNHFQPARLMAALSDPRAWRIPSRITTYTGPSFMHHVPFSLVWERDSVVDDLAVPVYKYCRPFRMIHVWKFNDNPVLLAGTFDDFFHSRHCTLADADLVMQFFTIGKAPVWTNQDAVTSIPTLFTPASESRDQPMQVLVGNSGFDVYAYGP